MRSQLLHTIKHKLYWKTPIHKICFWLHNGSIILFGYGIIWIYGWPMTWSSFRIKLPGMKKVRQYSKIGSWLKNDEWHKANYSPINWKWHRD